MKIKYTTLVLSFTLFLCATAIGIAQTTIYSNNFESDNGGWTDGGVYCEFRSNDTNSPQGSASWSIFKEDGDESAFWQDFDFSAYNEITITFSYRSTGFDDDDDRFRVRLDNSTILDKRYGQNGWNSNNTIYTETVVVNSYDHNFDTNTRIKFQTYKDTDESEKVYIDEIVITGSTTSFLFYENFSDDTSSGDANDFTGTDEVNNTLWTANEQGADKWDINNGRWRGERVETESSFTTNSFSISGYSDLQFQFYIDYDSDLDNTQNEWIKVFYTIDDDPEELLEAYYGIEISQTYTVDLPSDAVGDDIVLRIEMHHDNNKDEHDIDNIKLTGNPCTNPTTYNVTGDDLSACSGSPETTTAIGLDGSESGVTYQLLKDEVDEGLPIAGTGTSISFGDFSASGDYTVIATRTNGGCTQTMTGSVTIETVTAPTADFTVDPVVNVNELIEFENTTLGEDNTYAWDFGDGSDTSNDVNPTHTYTATGTYTVTLTATNSCGTTTKNNSLTVTLNYCNVTEDDSSYNDAITLVVFGSINNQTGIDYSDGYIDYTNLSATLETGSSTELFVKLNTDDGDYRYYATAWIDWNLDGSFDEINERYDLGFTENSSNGTTSGSPLSITVPTDATVGTTRMRVISKWDNYQSNNYPTDACTDIDYGEIEDYSIVVTKPASIIAIQDWDDTTPEWSYVYTNTSSGAIRNSGYGTASGNFWGMQGSTNPGSITFEEIAIGSYYQNPTFSFDYFVGDGVETSGGGQDTFTYQLYFNEGASSTDPVELITSTDGTNDLWVNVSVVIPANTTSISVNFNHNVTDEDGEERLGLDNVAIKDSDVNEWLGNATAQMNEVNNWSYGELPNETSTILIRGSKHLTIDSDLKVETAVVNGDGLLTITEEGSLTTQGDFISEGTVTLNSDATEFASIIVEGTATGEITYNKYINYLAYQEWDLVGSPVLNQNMQSFAQTHTNSNNTNNTGSLAFDDPYYALGEYLTEWGSFSNYTTSTIPNSSFPAGKGYQMATNPTGSGNDMEGQTLAFTGDIATTSQSINVQNQNGANNNNGRRWNLVSNPYPSYLKANEIADGGVGNVNNFISQNLSIMDQSFGGVYGWKADGSGYKAYNLANLSDQGITEALLIAPGQGFMIAASSTDIASLQFTPAMRSVVGGDDFISGAPMLLNHFLKLQLFNGSSQKGETSFFFQPNLTLGLNPGYDAGNLDQNTTLSSRLVQDDQGVNLEINAMDIESLYNQSIPLVINQQEGQSFRISISNNTLPEDINVYLEDVFNGTLTSLKNQDFELVAQEDLSQDGRFYIRFTTESLAINDVLSPSSINVFKLNTDNFITIKGLSPEMGKTSAALYNMLGMKVAAKALNSNTSTQTISTQGLSSGVYIISLTAGEQAISKKVIIQ